MQFSDVPLLALGWLVSQGLYVIGDPSENTQSPSVSTSFPSTKNMIIDGSVDGMIYRLSYQHSKKS
jgi:hypothetical protein